MLPMCLAAVSWDPRRIDMFGVGADGGMLHRWMDEPAVGAPQWSGWHSLGDSNFVSPPAAVAREANRLDVFAVDEEGAMQHNWWDGQEWHPSWLSLGGIFTSAPAAVSWDPHRIDVFGVGGDGAMFHNWLDVGSSQWAGWHSLGRLRFASTPAAVSWGPNRLDVFAVGEDGAMHHLWWDVGSPPTPDWHSLGGSFTSAPAAVSWGPSRIDVFGVGEDGDMLHNWFDVGSPWQPHWKSLGGMNFVSAPAAVAPEEDRLQVFAMQSFLFEANPPAMYRMSWEGQYWAPEWEELPSLVPLLEGGPFASAPTVVSRAPLLLEVFGVGDDGALHHNSLGDVAWEPEWGLLPGPVTAPFMQGPRAPTPHKFGSFANYLLASDCKNLRDVSVSIEITEDLVGSNGFSFQLNANSPKQKHGQQFKSAWQQYVVVVTDDSLRLTIQLWEAPKIPVIKEWFNEGGLGLPVNTLRAGVTVTIALENDADGNVTGVTFSWGFQESFESKYIVLTELETVTGNPVTLEDLAPIVAFELDIVGPDEELFTQLSGAGTIRYSASTALTPLHELPSQCVETGTTTAEKSNSVYGTLPLLQSRVFTQPFNSGATFADPGYAGPTWWHGG
jgi:hypothetical protein